MGITKQPNIPDLKISTQAVRQIIKEKTFYLYQPFLPLQDCQYCKRDLILSWEYFVEVQYNAEVYLNLGREICASRLLFAIFVRSDRAGLE